MLCTICIVDRLSFLNVGRILPYPYPPGVGLYIYYMYFCQEQYLTFTHHVFSSPPTRPGGEGTRGHPLNPGKRLRLLHLRWWVVSAICLTLLVLSCYCTGNEHSNLLNCVRSKSIDATRNSYGYNEPLWIAVRHGEALIRPVVVKERGKMFDVLSRKYVRSATRARKGNCTLVTHTAFHVDHCVDAGHRARWMQQRLAWHLYRIKVFDAYSHYTCYTRYFA